MRTADVTAANERRLNNLERDQRADARRPLPWCCPIPRPKLSWTSSAAVVLRSTAKATSPLWTCLFDTEGAHARQAMAARASFLESPHLFGRSTLSRPRVFQ